MSPNDDPAGRARNQNPELSLHGLSITPERPVARAEPLPPPAAGFTFVRELGRGGMGVVYEAIEAATGRRVALKIIAQRLGQNADAVERFEREARLSASIAHPNCVFVYGAHVIAGAAAISMELMTGQTLEDRLRSREPIPTETAVQWAMEMLDGLGAAHALGIVHRDVKPSNCFLTADGHVKVGDFGLSRSIEGDLGLTQSGAFIGSPLYASPEQIRGRALDQRTDVYSAGATLYALLAGRPPHSGTSMGDVLAQIVSEDPPALATLRPDLPRGLDGVVARSLAKDPSKRFADCAAFRRALLAYAPGSLTPATLGLRIGAYVIDSMIVSVVYQAACVGLLLAGMRFPSVPQMPWVPAEGVMARLFPTLLTIFWFGCFEAWSGATPGKRLLGLRVVTLQGGRAPLWRTLLRATVFIGPYSLPILIWGVDLRPWMSLLKSLAYAVPVVTMRKGNAYRGVHEFASGTRVLRVTPATAPDGIRALDPVRTGAADVPRSAGAYTVEGLVGTTPGGTVVVAHDPGLDRSVWIHFGAGPRRSDRDTTRPAVLRWLQHGDDPIGYDVYESPGGASLNEYAASARTFPWPRALPLLMSLAEELRMRGEAIGLGQIWIDRLGSLRVLDFPIGDGGSAPLVAVEALGHATRLLLVGATSPAGSIPADLPVHAEPAVRRLLALAPPFAGLDEAAAALRELVSRPTALSRRRRTGQIALAAGWFLLIGLIVVVAWAEINRQAGHREPHEKSDAFSGAVAGAILLAGGFCVPSLVLAFVLRGGLTFSMLGIRARNRSGALASRWHCLLRALVVSLPCIPVFAVAFIRSLPKSWYLVAGAGALTLLIYAAGVAWSLVTPNDGPADRIARTRLVPR